MLQYFTDLGFFTLVCLHTYMYGCFVFDRRVRHFEFYIHVTLQDLTEHTQVMNSRVRNFSKFKYEKSTCDT